MWLWMEDIRKLLRTFEPPSFVITKNHGTVTARKDNHGDLTERRFEEHVIVQRAEKLRVEQREGQLFSPDALSDWFVSVFPKLPFLDLVQTETNK